MLFQQIVETHQSYVKYDPEANPKNIRSILQTFWVDDKDLDFYKKHNKNILIFLLPKDVIVIVCTYLTICDCEDERLIFGNFNVPEKTVCEVIFSSSNLQYVFWVKFVLRFIKQHGMTGFKFFIEKSFLLDHIHHHSLCQVLNICLEYLHNVSYCHASKMICNCRLFRINKQK